MFFGMICHILKLISDKNLSLRDVKTDPRGYFLFLENPSATCERKPIHRGIFTHGGRQPASEGQAPESTPPHPRNDGKERRAFGGRTLVPADAQ